MSIKIRLSRDSVCMGDDIENHSKTIIISGGGDPISTILQIAKEYLATIVGHGHYWDCYLNGEKVAVIKGNCKNITQSSDNILLSNGDEFYFKYHSATY